MKILLKDVSLSPSFLTVNRAGRKALDIAIESKKIAAVGKMPKSFVPQKIIDAKGLIAIPGLIDLGVYLREPGYEYKATIASEVKAAAAGGITTVVAMPKTYPVIDSPTVVELVQNRARAAGLSRVLPVGAITKALEGKELSEMGALKEEGCVAVSNLNRPFASLSVMKRAFEYAAGMGIPVFCHPQSASLSQNGCAHDGYVAARLGLTGIPYCAETAVLSEYLAVAQDIGVPIHFCRLSCARSVELVQKAQKSGLPISADVAIHQLLCSEEDIAGFDVNYHVSPPFRSKDDRQALIEGVNNGVIGTICSDHQPHDTGSKLAPFPSSASGISGLETFFALVLRCVAMKHIKASVALSAVTSSPADVLQIGDCRITEGAKADICLFDPNEKWQFSVKDMLSSGRNTPFDGACLEGRVRYTICGGKIIYEAPS